MKPLSMKETGNCFEITAHIVMDRTKDFSVVFDNPFTKLVLCHGTVTRQQDQHKHIHAWVEAKVSEDMTVCIDKSNGLDVTMLVEDYYKLGNITDVVRYTRQETINKLLTHETYGPWHTGEN